MVTKATQIPQMPQPQRMAYEPVSNLLLDAQNPRFAASAADETQEQLLKVLWDEFAVDEVALSIAANGYFQEEPLLVAPNDPDHPNGPYVVIEGNRRLAAVILLRDDGLRAKLKATNLPNLDEKAKARLDRLPVSKYGKREDVWRYLGFRHINGPQPWDALSKAMYVANVHDKLGVGLDDIATSIGDRHSTVKRLYRGYKILEQAEQMTSFRRDDIISSKFFFSHLYTAADQPEFQRFLGIDPAKSLRPYPVPKQKLGALRELMVWFYGSKAEKRAPLVQRQNPDLNLLREVISESRGREALQAGLSLQRSHEVSMGDERRFRNSLTRAKEELQVADGTLTTGYSGEDDAFQVFSAISSIVESMAERIYAKRSRTTPKPR